MPQGEEFDHAVAEWSQIVTDEGAEYDRVLEFDAEALIPQVTWGTSPGMGTHYSSSAGSTKLPNRK